MRTPRPSGSRLVSAVRITLYKHRSLAGSRSRLPRWSASALATEPSINSCKNAIRSLFAVCQSGSSALVLLVHH
jgi:hypothetical protein